MTIGLIDKLKSAFGGPIADASEIGLDAGGFGTNLTSQVDNMQKLASAVDGLVVGSLSPALTNSVAISNAMLKTLDTDYVELAPAPGIGQYIELEQVWVQKVGSDEPRTGRFLIRVAYGPDEDLTETVALTGNLATAGFISTRGIRWTNESNYFFFGCTDILPDITGLRGNEVSDPGFFPALERIPGTLRVGEDTMKWWRTSQPYMSLADIPSIDSGSSILVPLVGNAFLSTAASSLRIASGVKLRAIAELITTNGYPLYYVPSNFQSSPLELALLAEFNLSDLLTPGTVGDAYAIGGHSLIENTALTLGISVNTTPPTAGRASAVYSQGAYDDYLEGVDDVVFVIFVRYRVHSIYQFS